MSNEDQITPEKIEQRKEGSNLKLSLVVQGAETKSENAQESVTALVIQPETAQVDNREDSLNEKIEISAYEEQENSLVPESEKSVLEAIWLTREPEDLNDPVPHILTDSYDNDRYSLIGASVRGKYHAHNALYREDSFQFRNTNDWIIVAVADGAGSAELSRIGSLLACKKSVEFLQEKLGKCAIPVSDNPKNPSEDFVNKIREILVNAVIMSQKGLVEEAIERKIEVKELATTLLIGICRPWNDHKFIAGIQIGDGSIALWDGDEKVTRLGIKDSGDYASETTFITSMGIEHDLLQKVFFFIWKDVRAISFMTDGVADDFYPEEKYLPTMFTDIQNRFIDSNNDFTSAILKWLAYERRGSFDDRTIALILFKG